MRSILMVALATFFIAVKLLCESRANVFRGALPSGYMARVAVCSADSLTEWGKREQRGEYRTVKL